MSRTTAKARPFEAETEAGLRGGTAAPRATIEKFRDLLGVFLLHAWGMTETSPLVTLGSPLAKHDGATADRNHRHAGQAGTPGLRRRTAPCRRRRRALAARRQVGRPAEGARQLGDIGLFQGRGRRGRRRRRLARHRRRRDDRSRWLCATDRPPEGRHQVRRRVDLLDRDRESRDVASRRVRGRRHRDRASDSGRSGRC